MFIIYTLILFICSNGLGKYFVKKDSKLYILKSLLGFLILLAILQLGYYPIQYFNLSSTIHLIWTSIVLLITFILGIKNLKKEDFNFLKSYEFYVFVILMFVVIKILPATEAGDDAFYMPFIMDNAYLHEINTVNPRTGKISLIDNVYWYQGYYLLHSLFYRIQNILFNASTDVIISFKTTMTLLSSIFASLIFKFMKDTLKPLINKYIYHIITLLSLLLVGVLEWSHIYWGSFIIFPIFIPLYILLFNEYLQEKDKKIKYALFTSNIGMISLASTSLFLNLIITFGFFIYELFKKQCKAEDYYFILIPCMLYACLILNILWLFPILLIMYFILLKYKNHINKFINKYLFYPLLALPIIFTILSLILYHNVNWSLYRLGYPILIFNSIITGIIIYQIIKNKEINPILFVFAVTFIYFFNPLVGPFVSHYMTSTTVFYRLFYITKNPVVITTIFITLYINFKETKVLKYLVITGISILLINYGYNLLKGTILEPTYFKSYNYLLRETKDSNDLGNYLFNLEEGKILSIYVAPRMYNNKLKTTVYRYPNDTDIRSDYWLNVLYFNETNVLEFLNSMKLYEYDYIIIYTNSNTIIDEYYRTVYQNDTFQLLQVK